MKSRYLEVLKLEYDILCGSGVAMGTGEEEVEVFWITGNQYQVSDVVDDERQKERWGVRLFKWWSSTKTAACSQMGLVRARRLELERGQVFKVFKVFQLIRRVANCLHSAAGLQRGDKIYLTCSKSRNQRVSSLRHSIATSGASDGDRRQHRCSDRVYRNHALPLPLHPENAILWPTGTEAVKVGQQLSCPCQSVLLRQQRRSLYPSAGAC